MKNTVLIFFTPLLFSNFSFAQNVNPINKTFFSIGYFGEKVFHPGLFLAVNRSLYLSKDLENQRNRLDIGFSISNYYHPKNHFGLRLTSDFSFIHSNNCGFEYGLKADAGFMRRFYQGKVFEVDGNANITQKYLAGQNSFTYGAYIILVKNWYVSGLKNMRFFAGLGGFRETNYSGGGLIHPSVKFGIGKYFKLKR